MKLKSTTNMETEITMPVMVEVKPNSKELIDLAYYLEGMYKGKGDLLPLGKVHIENLWTAIKQIQKE